MMKQVLVEDPKGKFLKISMDFEEAINDIVITGDFFAHPEEAIDELQKCLVGVRAKRKEVENALKDFFEREGVRMYGISPEGILKGIGECLEADNDD